MTTTTIQADNTIPLIPARMVNEFVYCPRLAYLEWVQGEFKHNEFTVDGAIRHKRVDKEGGELPEKRKRLLNPSVSQSTRGQE